MTDLLVSNRDSRFCPALGKHGSLAPQLDAGPERGGLKVNERFLVDFGREPGGPARAHDVRFRQGDSTPDVGC